MVMQQSVVGQELTHQHSYDDKQLKFLQEGTNRILSNARESFG